MRALGQFGGDGQPRRRRWLRTWLAAAVASLSLGTMLAQAPSASASWGIGGVTFGAFTEDGTEFSVQMRNTFGSDGLHLIVGGIGTRSSLWQAGIDTAPDNYPLPFAFFTDATRNCSVEESYPTSLAPTDIWAPGYGYPGGPCWAYVWDVAKSKPGPWGYGMPVAVTGPTGDELVFDHWDVTGADTAGRCYTGDVGIIRGSGLNGVNGTQVAAVGYRGYVDVLNPDPTKRGDYFAKAIYAPISPDTSAPIVTIQSDLDCQELEKGSVFTATYTCLDPGLTLQAVDDCTGPVPSGSPVDTSTVGVHEFTVVGTDAAGNSRSNTVHYTVVAAVPSVSIDDVTVTEGNSGTTSATFTVSLDEPTDNVVTVDYATAPGTATATDFTAASGTLTFAAGDVTKTLTVPVKGELNYEYDETFTVALSNPVNADLGTSEATGTITNDDAAPTASIDAVTSVVEGNSGTSDLAFNVSLSAPLERDGYIFTRQITGGTATVGEDYTALPTGSAGSIVNGFTFDDKGKAVITVSVLGDTTVEPDETVLLSISSTVAPVEGAPQPIVVTNGSSVGTITNDDGPPPSWFVRFAPPVDPAPTLNSLRAGQSVPIKFSLGGDRGLSIFASGSPSSQRVACSTSSPMDALEETASPGSSGLSYDSTTQLYNYTWKTSKSWAGTCRAVTLSFTDGTSKTVNFQLK